MVEGEIIAGRHFPESTSKKHTLAELLARYDREIVPTLAPSTQRTQRQRITFWSQRLGHKSLSDITKADVVAVKEDLTRRGRAS